MIELEWNGNTADVSKWFGECHKYVVSGFGLCAAEWSYYFGGAMGLGYGNYGDAAGAKAAALVDFNERLKKPMKYGPAMAAATRGCEVRRSSWPEGNHLRSDHTRLIHVDSSGSEHDYSPTLNAINADDWIFVLPEPEPEPEPEPTPLEMMKMLDADIKEIRGLAKALVNCTSMGTMHGYARKQARICKDTRDIRAKLIEEMSNR